MTRANASAVTIVLPAARTIADGLIRIPKYDPYDFGSVRLYWKDKGGEFRFERVAEPYMVIHLSLIHI